MLNAKAQININGQFIANVHWGYVRVATAIVVTYYTITDVATDDSADDLAYEGRELIRDMHGNWPVDFECKPTIR
jgi:hypothetical protein